MLMNSASGQYSGGSGQGINSNSVSAINLTVTNSMFSGGTDDGHAASTALATSLIISNSPYSGGSDDGCSSVTAINTLLTTNSNYSGGADDGISTVTALLPLTANSMFTGGTDDGFNLSTATGLVLGAATIYAGGADDGSSVSTQPAIDLTVATMYAGGNDDGISVITVTALNFTVSGMFSGGSDDGFSSFTTGPILITLPLTWLNFTVTGNGENALLYWKVSQEQNNAGYDIERSYDGIHFIKIGFVQAFNNSSTVHEYMYTDINPAGFCASGNCKDVFYRLVQKDIDHIHFAYSAIRKLKLNTGLPTASVYPNPATEQLNIRIYPINGNIPLVDAFLYNTAGAVVFQRSRLSTSLYQLNVHEYPSGIYYLKLIIDGQTYSYQISILH